MNAPRPLTSGVAIAAVSLLATAAPAAAAPAGVAVHEPDQGAAAVRSYWTPERMRAAEPIEPPASVGAGSVSEPAETAAIAPDQETNPALDTVFPQRVHGRLFVVLDGRDATCSATVVDSEGRDLIVTAGHCLVIPGEVSGGRGIIFASQVAFVPAYRNDVRPFGTYVGTRFATPRVFAQSADIAFDFGAVELAPGPTGPIQDALGARGIAFNRSVRSFRNDEFEIYGYPAKPEPGYDGERMIVCFSQFQGFERFTGAPVIGPCNQQEGSSGGGWVRNGRVESVVSHAGCATPTGCTLISGSYFGEAEFRVYRSIGGISSGKSKRLNRCNKQNKKKSKRLRCRARVQRFAADPR